jgi:uncharacterized membrane protein
MAKKRRDPATDKDHRPRPAAARGARLTPDWPVLVLSLIGAVLTAYLSLVALNRDAPAFCAVGSGCELIQQSRWSTLFGAPIALWGFGLYLALALSALFATPKVKPWRRIWLLAALGLAISLYLTFAGWIAIDAFCGWCLLSLALLAAIFAIATWRRPSTAPGMPWSRFALNNGIVLALVLGVLHAAQAGWLQPPESPRLRALAEHLAARGAKFYGASWCPNCREQKELFGRSAERLPYVECSPDGAKAPVALTCVSAGIEGFPTWIIRGRRYPNVLQPEELAQRSGFDWDGFVAPASD